MPATFQKIMDFTLANINSAHAFLDDIIIRTKGTLANHESELDKVLARLDKENSSISLHKREFAVTEITWLGYKINPDGIIPKERKTEAIIKMDSPKTLKQLRSLMCSIHKIIPPNKKRNHTNNREQAPHRTTPNNETRQQNCQTG